MANTKNILYTSSALLMLSVPALANTKKPNVVIVQVDEHSFRTIGAYRNLLTKEQAEMWGEGNVVKTPHLDKLAANGVLCSQVYSNCPQSSPSRATFLTGLYPQNTDVIVNGISLNENVETFAQVMLENGYATAYLGKWHLDEKAGVPGWKPQRNFGFADNRYMFNNGHWKQLIDTPNGPDIATKSAQGKPTYEIKGATPENYATDFLTDRTIDFIQANKNKPFCVMVSLPDPHDPNTVRAPYDEMYLNMKFTKPRTWKGGQKKQTISDKELAMYFGMVKCIDDNIGKLMKMLQKNGLDKNTIVVYTADHGDMLGEHNKDDKGVPHEASMKIPFIVQYPKVLPRGKVVHQVMSTVDFKPTILGLTGLKGKQKDEGTDCSQILITGKPIEGFKNIAFCRGPAMRRDDMFTFVSAVTDRYKLICSPKSSKVTLLDREKDPDELIDFANDPAYADIIQNLLGELIEYGKNSNDPRVNATSMGLYKGTKEKTIKSPNGNAQINLKIGETLTWNVVFNGTQVIKDSPIGLDFLNAPSLGNGAPLTVLSMNEKTINETWKSVHGKRETVKDNAHEVTVELQETQFPGRKFKLIFRAYNDGVAFRFFLPEKTAALCRMITNDRAEFKFTDNHTVWATSYPSFNTGQESEFVKQNINTINSNALVGLPLLVEISKNCYAAFTEANISNWAGMYFGKGEQDNSLQIKLAPLGNAVNTDALGVSARGQKVRLKEDAFSPWRVIMLADKAGKLNESSLIENLNDPIAIEDPSWIKPGICVWDNWWSGNVKMDTKTIKEFIDFAAENGFPYQLIDWQWYGPFNNAKADITTINPAVDMPEILRYAKEKNVGIWLWLHYADLKKQPQALALYEQWGIKGIKVDFMNRDDQEMVNWYHETVKLAAKHKLMVNFHGSFKPDGWSRTYPNLVTREGVLGNEYNKNSSRATPDHNVTLAYTRGLLGAMDYTPGGFLNKGFGEFSISTPTSVQGTRCHQLAMFVVYESAIATLCDHPRNYANQLGFDFIKNVPTSWKETYFLGGEVGESICLARKAENAWFIGALNNSFAKDMNIKLDFLPEGNYEITEYKDVENAATKVDITKKTVKAGSSIGIRMLSGGGFAAIIRQI